MPDFVSSCAIGASLKSVIGIQSLTFGNSFIEIFKDIHLFCERTFSDLLCERATRACRRLMGNTLFS